MLAALSSRDPDAAEAVAVEHVRTFRNRVKLFVDGASAGDLSLESASFDPDHSLRA
jgi:hypothetical protein